MIIRFVFFLGALLLLDHTVEALMDNGQPAGPYRSVITKPLFGPTWKVGTRGLTEFPALSEALNQMLAEGFEPTLFDVFVDFQRFDHGQNRFLIGGATTTGEENPLGQEQPYRAVLTRSILGPAWKTRQESYLAFPAVTTALNQLHSEGYEPFHMELYRDPLPRSQRVNPPMNRLLILARRR